MFELLKKRFIEDQDDLITHNEIFILNGCGEDQDRGLRRYSTDTRWNQYKNGEINRYKACEYAIKRMTKQVNKETAAKLAHLDRVAAAPDIYYIRVNVEWRRSSVCGYNPAVDVTVNGIYATYTGYASGCGYDKESAAIASAFNSCDSILKILYTLKENALAAGASDHNDGVITKVDNRAVIGYGAGYTVIPYFEGGVGASCYWDILKKAGFECRGDHGKSFDIYRLEKAVK